MNFWFVEALSADLLLDNPVDPKDTLFTQRALQSIEILWNSLFCMMRRRLDKWLSGLWLFYVYYVYLYVSTFLETS